MFGTATEMRNANMGAHAKPEHLPLASVVTYLTRSEFEFLLDLYRSAANTRPRFSFVDLTSACVALVRESDVSGDRIIARARSDIALRPACKRMRAGIWRSEFAFLRDVQRSPANRSPYPHFDLGDLTSACAAMAIERFQAADTIRLAALQSLARRTRGSGVQIPARRLRLP